MTAPSSTDDRLALRLLVVSRVVAARSGAGLRFQGLDGRYIEGIARHFRHVRVAAQVAVEGDNEAYLNFSRYVYRFSDPAIRVEELSMPRPGSPGMAATAAKQVRHWWQLRRQVGWCDLGLIFMPSYVGVLAASWCRLRRRPYAVYLGGDWGGYSPLAFRWRDWRSVLRRPYAWLNGRLERRVVVGAALALVSGAELLDRYAGATKVVRRTLPLAAFTAADLYKRTDTCEGDPCRLLFVGALLPGKGLQHLLAALSRLPGTTLDVAGTGRAEVESELRAIADREGVANRVRWRGYVAEPQELRTLYRTADIFVLPTLSEGAPRVVWEAMSQSLPVVTSDIPAIRAVLDPGVDAVLAPAADPEGLAAAIERVRRDGELRRALIERGLATARERLAGDPAEQAFVLIAEHVARRVRA